MAEEPMATIGVVPVYESELQRMLDEFGIKTSVVYGPPPSNEMLMKRTLEHLALTTRYDYEFWEAQMYPVVMSAMLNAYIDTGEVNVGMAGKPVPAANSDFDVVVTASNTGNVTLQNGAISRAIVGGDGKPIAANTLLPGDIIIVHLPPNGEMGPILIGADFFDRLVDHPDVTPGFRGKAATVRQPDYLHHDPTKQVHRRRPRKAYGRKGDRP